MIRYFAANFKPNRNNYSEIGLFYSAIKSFKPHKARCPGCGAKGRFSYHDSYGRYLVTYDGGVLIHEINIPRYICGSCGRPHAVLPEMLIPYSSYSLGFVMIVLRAYFFRAVSGMTVIDICDKFQIAASTLYAFKERFLAHKSFWLGAVSNLAVSETCFLGEGVPPQEMLYSFFRRFGFSFLQNYIAPYSSIP
jgi:ribosomal protein S27AE